MLQMLYMYVCDRSQAYLIISCLYLSLCAYALIVMQMLQGVNDYNNFEKKKKKGEQHMHLFNMTVENRKPI